MTGQSGASPFIRSVLFVPATKPERVAKAISSGAGAVIVDLEDAVDEAEKGMAREQLQHYLAHNPLVAVLVRVNGFDSTHFNDDLALCGSSDKVSGIVVPKAETREAVAQAARFGKPVWPLIESSQGLLAIQELAETPGVERLAFGALDLSAELGISPDSQEALRIFDQCRFQILIGSHAAGLLPPIDGIPPALFDEDAIEKAAKHAAEMGFSGMFSIHPRQVSAIHRGFSPAQSEIEWALKVVQAAQHSKGAFQLGGQMIDAPVIARARTVLAKSGGAGQCPPGSIR